MSDVNCTGKLCPKCGVFKREDEFGKIHGKIRSYCRPCHRVANFIPDLRKEKYCPCCQILKPVGQFNRSQKRYQPHCRECQNTKSAKWWADKKESGESVEINRLDYWSRRKWTAVRSRYGIDKDDYDRMIKLQENRCAICGKPETEKQRGRVQELSIDHDHKTGRVRGLLRRMCNIALGRFREDVTVLQNAINYLKHHS